MFIMYAFITAQVNLTILETTDLLETLEENTDIK